MGTVRKVFESNLIETAMKDDTDITHFGLGVSIRVNRAMEYIQSKKKHYPPVNHHAIHL